MNDGRVWAKATVNLPGFPAGAWRLVDPDDEYAQMLFARGYLVRDESQDARVKAGARKKQAR